MPPRLPALSCLCESCCGDGYILEEYARHGSASSAPSERRVRCSVCDGSRYVETVADQPDGWYAIAQNADPRDVADFVRAHGIRGWAHTDRGETHPILDDAYEAEAVAEGHRIEWCDGHGPKRVAS